MSKQVIRDHVQAFLANGGQVTVCPTRTCYGGHSYQRRITRSQKREDTHAS